MQSQGFTLSLKIILKEFLSLKCRFEVISQRSVTSIFKSFPAVMHIGDNAMIEAKKQSAVSSQHSAPFIYDLGKLWDKYTGLPFVYALWVVRKKSLYEKSDLIKQLSVDLINSKKYANKKLSMIAGEAPHNKWISRKELVSYWKTISYDYTDKHVEGLNLFEQYVKKNKL